ncbi:MAG: leucyl aminopeptidase [Acidimicrobiia bacterium]|nr:leucyl aminopeptidase [Acidimicrobiia bacterium]
MSITQALARSRPAAADLDAHGVFVDGDLPDELDPGAVEALGFEAKAGTAQLVVDRFGAVHLLLGLGEPDELDVDGVRKAGVQLARKAADHAHVASHLLDSLPEGIDAEAAAQAMAEGVELGAYRFVAHKSDPDTKSFKKVTHVGGTGARLKKAIERGSLIGQAVAWARDLVNEPGGSLTPPEFARRAGRMARRVGLKTKIMDEKAIEAAKLGGLLGVNRGSKHPPRLVQLTYEPDVKPRGTLALVGKGITFDAGGLSIKTGQGMMTMKCDMGGGAAVLGAMSAIAQVAPPVRVIAFVPMTDNMLGDDATRPGDVLTIRNTKTVEVLNTDAEGRLILADALSLACEAEPDAIVDLATLTGACMVALGPSIAGLMANHDEWRQQVADAGERSGERVWPLPLPDDYRKMLDSTVADVKNIGGPYGGALTAGLFLKEFVTDDLAWAHVDIAGPAFGDAQTPLGPAGASGYGVRLLVELAEEFRKP